MLHRLYFYFINIQTHQLSPSLKCNICTFLQKLSPCKGYNCQSEIYLSWWQNIKNALCSFGKRIWLHLIRSQNTLKRFPIYPTVFLSNPLILHSSIIRQNNTVSNNQLSALKYKKHNHHILSLFICFFLIMIKL